MENALITGAAVGLGQGIASVYVNMAPSSAFSIRLSNEATAQELRDLLPNNIIQYIGDVGHLERFGKRLSLRLSSLWACLECTCCNAWYLAGAL